MLGITLYIIGLYGFILRSNNFILMYISIEIMLLGLSILTLNYSILNDDLIGLIYGMYIIAIAGAESAIGLGILMTYYRFRGSISIIPSYTI